MTAITANDLKKRGVSALDPILKDKSEVVITVRGNSRYVVMDMDAYHHFRTCELEAALMETQQDLESGNYHVESIADHVRRVADEI
ncbi:MAG: type II toxin-antitoxin system Phd/YefM family antitoxin [Verrucomicrobiota bacterium]